MSSGPSQWRRLQLAGTAAAPLARIRIPTVHAAEHLLHGDGGGFPSAQLSCPRHTRTRVRARAVAFVLGVACCLLAFGEVPVVPAFGAHDRRHLRVQEGDGRVCAPRAAQVGFYFRRRAGDAAMREDETERLIVGRGGGGQVAVLQGVYVATLEEGGRRAEDEIHVPFDVTVLEVLPAAV